MFFAYAVSTESSLSLKLRVKKEITTANLAEGRWAMGWEKGNYSEESMNGSHPGDAQQTRMKDEEVWAGGGGGNLGCGKFVPLKSLH